MGSAAPDDAQQLAGEIVARLRSVSIASDRFVDGFASRHGLHSTDLAAMAHVWAAGRSEDPITPGRLAEALRLSSPATAALLNRLERAGHLRRVRHPHDRRKVHITMNPAAESIVLAFFAPLGAQLRQVMRGYTADDLAVIHRFLGDATEAINALPTAGSPAPSADAPRAAMQ